MFNQLNLAEPPQKKEELPLEDEGYCDQIRPVIDDAFARVLADRDED